jgi:hypothetical protein
MSDLLSGSNGAPAGYPPYSETTLPRSVATLSTLLALALLTYSTRIWNRARSYGSLGMDDYAISLAMVSSIEIPKKTKLIQVV